MSEDWRNHDDAFQKEATRIGLPKECGLIGICNEGHEIWCICPERHETLTTFMGKPVSEELHKMWQEHGTCGTPCGGGHKDGVWFFKVKYK